MTTSTDDSPLLRQQLDYYRARANEYDEWWLRKGRYDRGPELNKKWFAEAALLRSALADYITVGKHTTVGKNTTVGKYLDLACGTGIWTHELHQFAFQVTAVDASPEMLKINAARLRSPNVRYIEANLFEWHPDEQFDLVFFGFWLSHVPPERFAQFWELVRSCVTPNGRVFFVDSRREPTSTAIDHRLSEPEAALQRRRLNDGREFQVYKIFHDPADLTQRLRDLGWDFQIRLTDTYFIYGSGQRTG